MNKVLQFLETRRFRKVSLAVVIFELTLVLFDLVTVFILDISCTIYNSIPYQIILSLSLFGLVPLIILFIIYLVLLVKQRKWKRLLAASIIGSAIIVIAVLGVGHVEFHCLFNFENTNFEGFYWGPH